MSAQVYSLLAKLLGEIRSFLEGESIDLSLLSLTCGVNVTHYKSVQHSFSTLPVGIEKTQVVFKTNQ